MYRKTARFSMPSDLNPKKIFIIEDKIIIKDIILIYLLLLPITIKQRAEMEKSIDIKEVIWNNMSFRSTV